MRTSEEDVLNILGLNCCDDLLGCTSLFQFIETANILTNHVAKQDKKKYLCADVLLKIETYLAAHFYSLHDPGYRSRATMEASGSFHGETGKYLEFSPYGQQAKLFDFTGTLAALDQEAQKGKPTLGIYWLGKKPDRTSLHRLFL